VWQSRRGSIEILSVLWKQLINLTCERRSDSDRFPTEAKLYLWYFLRTEPHNKPVVAPREARNLGIERGLMKLVTVTQWVRADTAQVPPDQRLATRSGANSTCTPSNGSTELEGARR
jgi:hypothetical protein